MFGTPKHWSRFRMWPRRQGRKACTETMLFFRLLGHKQHPKSHTRQKRPAEREVKSDGESTSHSRMACKSMKAVVPSGTSQQIQAHAHSNGQAKKATLFADLLFPSGTGGCGYIALAHGLIRNNGAQGSIYASLLLWTRVRQWPWRNAHRQRNLFQVRAEACMPRRFAERKGSSTSLEFRGAKPYMFVVTRRDVRMQVYSLNVNVHLDMYNNKKTCGICTMWH